jgi:NADPH:quinone reductase-like Zn-dependent oxidoreductase
LSFTTPAVAFARPSPPGRPDAPLDGMLTEQIALYEDGIVPIPRGYSYEEAACLPCAGVTAWHALFRRKCVRILLLFILEPEVRVGTVNETMFITLVFLAHFFDVFQLKSSQ